MRLILSAAILCQMTLFGQIEKEPVFEPAPLLRLAPAYPLQISRDNYELIMSDQHEIERNIEIFQKQQLPILGIGLFFLAALFITLAVLKPPMRPPMLMTPKIARGNAAMALSRLEHLPKEVAFVELTTLMRRFLNERYQLSIQSETTEEFTKKLDNQTFTEEINKQLIAMLNIGDLVKFARYKPTQAEYSRFKEFILFFINL